MAKQPPLSLDAELSRETFQRVVLDLSALMSAKKQAEPWDYRKDKLVQQVAERHGVTLEEARDMLAESPL